jgi:hypothetical protein
MALCVFLAACSNPESDGKKTAEKFCDCKKEYEQSWLAANKKFVADFDSYHFQTRTEAREKLDAMHAKVRVDYEKCEAKAKQFYADANNKYATKMEQSQQFKFAYSMQLSAYITTVDTASLNEVIVQKKMTIIPPNPDAEKIKKDLVGHTIIEPTRELYRSKFAIKSLAEIKEVKISEAKKDGDKLFYSLHLELTGEVNQYIADINLTYYLGANDDWMIQHIESKLLDIVPIGKFNDCISVKHEGYYRYFYNNCDVALLVEGVVYDEWSTKGWVKKDVLVPANGNTNIYGFKDYKLKRIERP